MVPGRGRARHHIGGARRGQAGRVTAYAALPYISAMAPISIRRAWGELLALTALTALLSLTALAGCSRHPKVATPPAAPADTLLARIEPSLADWLALWKFADPTIVADSLARVSQTPFTLRDIRGFAAFAPGARARLNRLGTWAPDSMRVVEPDTAVMLSETGMMMHVANGQPATAALVDLKINSIATLDTLSGELDGAFWDGNERFGLTGSLPPDSVGLRRALIRYYDLTEGTVTEFHSPGVSDDAWRRYLVARESARAARLRAANP